MLVSRAKKNQSTYENGFTLVEVLASIVIISVILLGVVNLFSFTSKTAVSNNAKLVTTHLAKATLERVNIQQESYFPLHEVGEEERTYTKSECQAYENCQPKLYQLHVNDQTYDVELKVSQNEDEKELHLINVMVEVKLSKQNIKSTVEGYVIPNEISEE